MLITVFISLVLIAITTLVHYEVLRELNERLPRLRIPKRFMLLVVVFSTLFAHIVEIGVYGCMLFILPQYLALGALSANGGVDLMACLYYSAETYTSLGFGDITPSGPLRLLAGAEALNGLLLIGWSASYLLERFWSEPTADRHA